MEIEMELEQMKESMKQIVKNTNSVLKHSVIAFKKTKRKMLFLDNVPMTPTNKTKEWFEKHGVEKITIPDFFDLLFKLASSKNRLDFTTRTITFSEEDAIVFGFPPESKVSIVDIFENLSKYFE